MCIIITKKHGAKPLPEKMFSTIWDNNPDGGGILFNDGKTTTLIKGIMKKEDFLKKVKQANKKECSFVIHTRIATHGSVKPENTHPFVSKTLGFAHNGTMCIEPAQDMTDSETFFLETIADKSMEWCKENKFLLDLATHGSRCVVFNMLTGELLHLCEMDWKQDKRYEGYMFSNGGYEEAYRYRYPTPAAYGGMGTAAFDRWEDVYDWEEEMREYDAKKSATKFETKDFDKCGVYKNQKEDVYNTSFECLDVNYKGDYVVIPEYAMGFVEDFATKSTNDAMKVQEMQELIRKLNNEFETEKYYEGQEQYHTQALSIMLSFLKEVSNKGYYDKKEVFNCFKEFVNAMVCDTNADQMLVIELQFITKEWEVA